MKKSIFIVASLLVFAACNKEVISDHSSDVGYLSFGLAADDVIVETKSQVTNLDSYSVYIDNTSYNYGSDIKGKVLEKSPRNYQVYAENITPEQAHSGNGELRLASPKQDVTVTAGATTTTTLACTAVNSKITLTFNDSFRAAFDSWGVVIGYEGSDERDMTVTNESTNMVFFYNIHPTIENLELSLTATTKSDNSSKSNYTKFKLEAGHHYTVNYSAGANGFVGITVNADDQLIDAEDTNVTVNPYAPNQNSAE